MNTALRIAARHLRSRLRDPSVLAVAFVAPLALAVVLSLGPAGGRASIRSYGIVDEDGGQTATAFVDHAREAPELADGATLRRYTSPAAARAALEGGETSAVFVLAEGLSRRVAIGVPARLEVWRSEAEPASGELAESLAHRFAAGLDASHRSLGLARRAGRPSRDVDVLARAAHDFRPAVSLEADGTRTVPGAAAGRFGAAMAVLFVFVVASLGPAGLRGERRQGTLARVRAAPVRPRTVLAGASLAVLVLGVASMGLLWAATTGLLAARWGDPVGVAILGLATIVAAVAITTLVATLARTHVDGWTSVVVLTLALVGGNVADVLAMPALLQRLSLATPNGWALRGFADLAAGGGAGSALGPAGAVVCFAAAAWLLALPRLGRLCAP